MNKDAVQHERGPRNSTLRRQQMTTYFNEASAGTPNAGALNLAVPRLTAVPSMPLIMMPSPRSLFNTLLSIPIQRFRTEHTIPNTIPAFLTPQEICEISARVLFANVEWVKNIARDTLVPHEDRLILIEESWTDLFILGYAELLPITDLPMLVRYSGAMERSANQNVFLQRAQEFHEILMSVKEFGLDRKELNYMRAIAFFNTSFERPGSSSDSIESESRGLTDRSIACRIHDDAQLCLNHYVTTTYPNQPLRFGRLLLLLVKLRNIPGEVIVELFFKRVIGDIPINTVISNVFKSKADYNVASFL